MRTRNAILLSTVVNLGIASIGAATGVLTARALGPDQRGYLSAVMAWFAISLVISEYGQSAAVTFFVARNPARSAAYIAISRKIMVFGSIIIGGLGFVFADFLSGGQTEVTLAYRIIFIGTLINALGASPIYALQSLSLVRWNLVRLSPPLFYLICLISLYFLGELTLVTAAFSTVLSLIGQLVFAWFLVHLLGLNAAEATKADSSGLMKYGTAQAASAVPTSLTENYDRVVLSWSVGAYELGQYAVALTVSQASRALGTAITSAVFPMSARLGNAEPSRIALERRSLWVSSLSSALALLLIGWISQPVVPILFGEDFKAATTLVWLLIPVIWLRGINSLVGVFLRGRNYPLYAVTGQILSLVVGGTSLLVLTPGFGVQAAPLGFCVAELLALAVNFAYLRHARMKSRGDSLSSTS